MMVLLRRQKKMHSCLEEPGAYRVVSILSPMSKRLKLTTIMVDGIVTLWGLQ